MASGLIMVLVAGGACRHPGSDAVSDSKAELQARYVLGQPEDVPIQGFDQALLKTDALARRRASWRLFQLVNHPVELKDPRTDAPLLDESGRPMALPLWQTWYSMTEFRALLGALIGRLGGDTSPVGQDLVEEVFRAHHRRVLDDPFWTGLSSGGARLDRFIDSLDTQLDARGLGGPVGRGQTLFSPALVRHLLLNYRSVVACAASPSAAEDVSISAFGTCVGGPFPANAIAIKANWVKATEPVKVYDTSLAALRKIVTGETSEWVSTHTVADPASIVLAGRLQNLKKLGTYRLVGFSIASKETPEWLWSTYWWSPEPESDFGADNPLRGGNHPFGDLASYKMCSVADFRAEAGPESGALLDASPGELTAMGLMDVVRESGGGATWCSNPYIEAQPGGANSNCIGCHQHAGPDRGEFEEDVRKDAVRSVFAGDFLWSFDSFKESFKDEIVRVVNENPGQ